ncbi:MBL fold metallo-hydrolase [Pseudoalteromonas piscicida]|uniref:MBL fold metallo-hydrolase n=1 Tax=Pseudoalteromonas piscicida TaxID=43662 RepID=A0AAD0W621_PSEO7|nr:MBL fold metallo-hydrolase [Pseudoalteromonas piscicida]ASD69418.1 ribonuclease Z [Pseudoalteromonas piscicida]AXR00027.1 MBL fold metallo-hydrolase [Pseudoalteromonas piscicida]AXR04222.1 MBL fold metallo-hydrolase [Pseudoalteromonas piscicida]
MKDITKTTELHAVNPKSFVDSHCKPDAAVFLGVGSAASAATLGCSACVLTHKGLPWLLIDCGFDTVSRYKKHFSSLPDAVFITHLHYDHVSGLEQLYFQAALSQHQVTLYAPAELVVGLCNMLAYTGLSEGNCGLWQVFRLFPISESFLHRGQRIHSYAVRHHEPNSAFSLHLPGSLFYSGDTKAIPELLHHHVSNGEVIFHDCGLATNPSHCSLDELLMSYREDIIKNIWIYHYQYQEDVMKFERAGLKAVLAEQSIAL